jgi:hypothetical protein
MSDGAQGTEKLNVIEFEDSLTGAHVSLIHGDDGMVTAVGYCYKDNPQPLSKFFTHPASMAARPMQFGANTFPVSLPTSATPAPVKPCADCGKKEG